MSRGCPNGEEFDNPVACGPGLGNQDYLVQRREDSEEAWQPFQHIWLSATGKRDLMYPLRLHRVEQVWWFELQGATESEIWRWAKKNKRPGPLLEMASTYHWETPTEGRWQPSPQSSVPQENSHMGTSVPLDDHGVSCLLWDLPFCEQGSDGFGRNSFEEKKFTSLSGGKCKGTFGSWSIISGKMAVKGAIAHLLVSAYWLVTGL